MSAADDPTAFRPAEETPTVVVRDPGTPSAANLTPGAVLGGRYRIVSMVGRGGMGAVYRADDLKIGHTVALKFLSHREHATRLYEEVRIGREIAHPNVCRLYDAAEVDGQLFITMEFIDGEDLASLLRRVGRLPVEKALAVAHDIIAGVAAAHERGVIHRDLKPANVMIDGRGRARVTDFGLAIAGDEAADRSGTPAYMAPEQLEGAPASVATDIYALGLVLYEIFTGRRAFEATSIPDLIMRQRGSEFSRPISVTRDIPVAVERIILRCLDPDPKLRPASVDEIRRELPGGDPLAAALAAGETPSPAMVAAAAKVGDLPALAAWGALLFAAVGLIASAGLSQRTSLGRVAEMKSPDVLQERARQILGAAGVTSRPADHGFFMKTEPLAGEVTAVYRQSESAMRPRTGTGVLSTFDPPLEPGMANVELDARGVLRRVIIAPPRIDKRAPPGDPDWAPLLDAAGHSVATVRPAPPEWASAIIASSRSVAFVDSDRKYAWLTKDGKRIEAASFGGRPVFFSVITPEVARRASAPRNTPGYLPEQLAFGVSAFFMIAIPLGAIAIARSNLRRRQGDRAGALRVAVVFLAVSLVGHIARAHHSMRFADEFWITFSNVASATFWTLITAILYIALEPFVRRHWPQMLISWSRLLSGRLRDPMIGRDILIGGAAAMVTIMVWHATRVVAGTTLFDATQSLGPPRFVVYSVAMTFAESLLRGVGLVILLVLLRALIPNDAVASVLAALLIAMMALGDTYGPPWLRAMYAVPAAVAGVGLTHRFGLLAAITYVFFVLVQQRVPLTLDSSTWYFGRSMVILLLLFGLLTWAFRHSVGSRRWLPRVALE